MQQQVFIFWLFNSILCKFASASFLDINPADGYIYIATRDEIRHFIY